MNDNYDDLQASYGRCLRHGHFIERFYRIFVASHPDIPALFANTDFSKQYMALRRGISSAIVHAAGSRLAERTMDAVAHVHDHAHFNVSPSLYPYWIDSLLQAIRESDPDYTPQLDKRWRQAMETTMKFFAARY